MLDIKEDNKLSLLWWISLSTCSLVNIIVYCLSLGSSRCNTTYFLKMKVYSGFYVFACAFRSFFPRIDVERICFWDSSFSLVFFGRSAATIAELCFIAQISLFLKEISKEIYFNINSPKLSIFTFFANLILAKIFLAQTMCWLGVLTTRQIFHCIEESLWMTSSAIYAICFIFIYRDLNPNSNNTKLKTFLFLFIILTPVFVAYMFYVDIPMYYRRWNEGNESNLKYLTLTEGFYDVFKCKTVSQSFSYWKEDILWMTPYFSACVWTSMYLSSILPKTKVDICVDGGKKQN